MYLKDITEEQAIEIFKLAYPGNIRNKTPVYNFHYQAYDKTMFEDALEQIVVVFESDYLYDGIYNTIRMFIHTNLDCYLSVYDDGVINGKKFPSSVYSISTQNQYHIQKKFREWGIYPNKIEMRESEINKLIK